MVAYLIVEGKYSLEDLNYQSHSGFTAAHIAAGNRLISSQVLGILLSKGADFTLKTPSGKTAYDIYYSRKISQSFDETGYANSQRDLLQMVLCNPNHELPVNAGELIIKKDTNERTPLFSFVCQNDLSLLERISQFLTPEIINMRDRNQQTVLHIAMGYCADDIVMFLLAHGADITLNDKNENTPLTIAKPYGRHELLCCVQIAVLSNSFKGMVVEREILGLDSVTPLYSTSQKEPLEHGETEAKDPSRAVEVSRPCYFKGRFRMSYR